MALFENTKVWLFYYPYEYFLLKLQYKRRAFMNQRSKSFLVNKIVISYQLQNSGVWNDYIRQSQFINELNFLLLLYKVT